MGKEYNVKSIYKMEEITHIREHIGMYLGNTDDSRKIFDELADNAFDEVLAEYADIVGVIVDTEKKILSVLDNGRGFPMNPKLSEEKDPPIMATTQLMTSGKFKKSESSAYKIAAGLHGIGLTAVNATCKELEIQINRDNLHAVYKFENAKLKERKFERFLTKESKFSTQITVKPDPKYFNDPLPPIEYIEERLRLACATLPRLKAILMVDGERIFIHGSEDEIIVDYLSKTVGNWIRLESKNRKGENFEITLGWDEEPPITSKILGCVNLVRVNEGVHINHIYNTLKNVFESLAKKYKYSFEDKDCLIYLRLFVNLQIIRTSFEAQAKCKLSNRSDVTILYNLEKLLRNYLDKNPELTTSLLKKFQIYRNNLQTKKLLGTSKKNKRSFNKLTKLRDCSTIDGELLIGEGDSAIGGLIQVRDPRIHAVLPLKGVIPNSLTKKDLLLNVEVKEIIQALGCGINENCDIKNLRYNKIILSADADPAGHFITSLLIILFAKLTPDLIKAGKLFVCRTPLFGIGQYSSFRPIWTREELEKARNNGSHIRRFKGLGEYNPSELYVFTLDKKQRKLIKVKWSERYEKIFKLMMSSEEKRKLIRGEWKINE